MNNKPFRPWHSDELARGYEQAMQIVDTIVNQEADSDLPPSIVPSDILLNICVSYLEVYDKLEAYSLLKDWQHKQHKTIN